MKRRGNFVMKQFELSDINCGCKIGVDGTLIGSWIPIHKEVKEVLDVGCGCGLIALMVAQRCNDAMVTGIDIDDGAIEDATINIRNSKFSDRIEIKKISLEGIAQERSFLKYDLIVSNPPFYESGVNPSASSRMLARHTGSLSPESLIIISSKLLKNNGGLGFIGPAIYIRKYLDIADNYNMIPRRICFVKGHPKAECKRVMVYLIKKDICSSPCRLEHINIKDSEGKFSDVYLRLGKEFYLKF
ncbi:MAG: methyltransferase [Muribaculaceae bacterium]|nr:methyltransferase [Muribaculaceae bacterium]